MDRQGQYETEVALAKKAKAAYESFIQDFIRHKKGVLLDNFVALNAADNVQMANIKYLITAFDCIDKEIRSIIDTGVLANISLEEMNKETNT